MRRYQKWFPYIIVCILMLLGLYVLCRGLLIAGENGWGGSGFFKKLPGKIEELAVDTYNGVLTWETETETGDRLGKSMGRKVVDVLFPPLEETEAEGEWGRGKGQTMEESEEREVSGKEGTVTGTESQMLSEKARDEILDSTENTGSKAMTDENGKENGSVEQKPDRTIENFSDSETEPSTKEDAQDFTRSGSETENETTLPYVSAFSNSAIPTPAAESLRQAPQVLPWADMKDFNFLLNQYFILDTSAAIDESLLNLDNLMEKDLTINTDTDGPQILIYHTHSQEAFVDSRPGDLRDTVIGVGERLKEILTEQYGFEVLHHTKVYDMIDGKLDRNRAYNLAAPDIEAILKAYPSIQVVIDLHRDGVEDYRFVTEFNGKPVAKIMFYNGLSRTARNGSVDYLPNPYIADNLAFSFQLQMKAAEYYPGFTRNIYLQSLRYNQHLCSHSLLIESGTQLNTVEEEYNAMEPLADILNQVLRGE